MTGCGFVLILIIFRFNNEIFIAEPFVLPVIMIGFGVFLLFDKCTFHSRIVNRIAQSTFAVYLITDYPTTRALLWKNLFVLNDLYQQPFVILQILGILIAIYIACTLIDFARQGLFAVTVDRNRGHWFELLWKRLNIPSSLSKK